jgi:sec-independent protein translocase protein TatB
MFGVGGQELILLMLIGLIVLGPERLPRIANQIGGWLGQARRMTRVMKRQLEEELDFNEKPTIKPSPSSREPSKQPEPEKPVDDTYTPPSDDDEFSPAHSDDDYGTGVGEEPHEDDVSPSVVEAAKDRAASDEEAAAVEEALTLSDEEPAEKKEAS